MLTFSVPSCILILTLRSMLLSWMSEARAVFPLSVRLETELWHVGPSYWMSESGFNVPSPLWGEGQGALLNRLHYRSHNS